MKKSRVHLYATGLPQHMPERDGFNLTRHIRGLEPELNNTSTPKTPGYRERKARQLLARMASGELFPAACAGIERDYAPELAKLRKAAR